MDDLLREFVGETLEMMEAVAGDLVAWEANPADRSGIDRIFRTVHTVKGSSGFFDLPRIAAVSHAAEELLDALRSRSRDPDAALVGTVLAAFERIRMLTQAIAGGAGEPAGDDSALIAELLADVRGARPPVVAAPEAPASDGDTAAGGVPQAWRSVRLPVGLLDELMNGVSDLVLARNEVAAQLRAIDVDPAAMPAFERLSTLLGAVRASVGQMRMVPLRTVFAPLPRLVRQLCSELGKDVHIEVEGGEIEIDREVGESLRDPIVHVLRNAIDHGIEPAAQRIAAGKAGSGTIRVTARQSNNRILIAFEDDGAGVSIDHVAARAVAKGVISAAVAETMDAATKAELIFRPGLSTAAAVTGISGRGVGMDVVRANVERLGGYVHMANRPGQGLTITFDVPMTLTIISALAIDVGDQSFAMPRSAVAEVLLASSDSVVRQSAGGAGLVRVRGRLLPLLVLEDVLGLRRAGTAADAGADPDRAIILCRISGGRTVALDVPDVRDHEELVIKPLPPILLGLGLYSGMSLPDNGRPMLLLDADGIARRSILPDIADTDDGNAAGGARTAITDMWLLFRTIDHARIAALPMAMIERLIDVPAAAFQQAGGRTVVRVGDRLLPVAMLEEGTPRDDVVRLIRVGDGRRSLLVPVAEIGEMTALDPALAADPARPLLALAHHGGDIVEMIDGFRLLGSAGAHAAAPAAPTAGAKTIWIVAGGSSAPGAAFLIPSLVAAGYAPRLVPSAAEVMGDGPVLTLGERGEGDARVGGASVDIYDRAALLDALGHGRQGAAA